MTIAAKIPYTTNDKMKKNGIPLPDVKIPMSKISPIIMNTIPIKGIKWDKNADFACRFVSGLFVTK
jgi:hypothetical protein